MVEKQNEFPTTPKLPETVAPSTEGNAGELADVVGINGLEARRTTNSPDFTRPMGAELKESMKLPSTRPDLLPKAKPEHITRIAARKAIELFSKVKSGRRQLHAEPPHADILTDSKED